MFQELRFNHTYVPFGYSPNANACSRSKEVWILIKEFSQPYFSFSIEKNIGKRKKTTPKQESFTTCTCTLHFHKGTGMLMYFKEPSLICKEEKMYYY